MQNNMQNVSDSVSDPVPGHSGYSVPSMEGVFCHSVLPAEEDLQNNLSHSVPSTEIKSLLNCAGIQQMSNPGKLSISLKVGSNNHSLAYLPLTQEKVETTYADIFKGLGKFPGDSYKLRLKPDSISAKHRSRRVPIHL